ncbi:MAG: bifunctional riboflavin kinase/FAD synthetase [Ignavibacteriae bacterium]|nr:bifunctional riboflavin kinase/FAD synthetase [Ignavibacteriota bacterium]
MLVIKEGEKTCYNINSVVTVGTFDGIHLGHKKIISDLIAIKNEKNLRSVIVTFDPHPQIILKNKHKEIKLLSTTEEKLQEFEKLGIDLVYIINFTKEFSEINAEDFYKNYLIEKIGLADIVLGFDHNFGKNREGNYESLKSFSAKYGFDVHKVDEFKLDGDRINSTTIRNFLLEGDVEKASFLLGNNYSFSGKVVYGDKRGNKIGFPTANIKPLSEYKLIPKNGVYFVSAEVKGEKYFGMMNIENRPTIQEQKEVFLEVNIFDFNRNIYDEVIKINFIRFLREEKKFASLDELVSQLNRDKEICKKLI